MEKIIEPFLEGKDEKDKKQKLIIQLESILKQALFEVLTQDYLDEISLTELAEINLQLYLFGSSLLGINLKGGDLDLLCVGPKLLNRQLFCTRFLEQLKTHKEITKIKHLPFAFVPLIKLTFLDTEIDLLYAHVPYTNSIYKQFEKNNFFENINKLDPQSIRSLNGYYLNKKILDIVISYNKLNEFRQTVQFLKIWAKNRGIYSNVLGYLGGVNFVLLVTYIIINYNKEINSCNDLLRLFFNVFSKWQWEKEPVYIVKEQKENDDDTSLTSMNIMTPIIPSSNTTFNVNLCTLEILKSELARGCGDLLNDYNKLIQPYSFFNTFNSFLTISFLSSDDLGFIQSKIRHFVANIYEVINKTNKNILVRLWPQCLQTSIFFIGIKSEEKINCNISDCITTFKQICKNKVTIEFITKQQASKSYPNLFPKREKNTKTTSPPITGKKRKIGEISRK